MRDGGGLAARNGMTVDGIAGLGANRSSSLKFGGGGLETGGRCMYGRTQELVYLSFFEE
jgi:hypothetical protein